MKLTRKIVSFDLETTGTDIAKDRIISIGMIRSVDWPIRLNKVERFYSLVNPLREITAEITELTGITNEMVKDAPTFDKLVPAVEAFIEGSDLIGFNLKRFDVPMLAEEMDRCGVAIKLKGVNVIDAGNIFKLKEKRDLETAVKVYCGRPHAGAHNAAVDAMETIHVLAGQIAKYADLQAMDVAALAEFSSMDKNVDLAGKFVYDKDGDYAYNFGKQKGSKVKADPSLARWMFGKDFTRDTLRWAETILDSIYAAQQDAPEQHDQEPLL